MPVIPNFNTPGITYLTFRKKWQNIYYPLHISCSILSHLPLHDLVARCLESRCCGSFPDSVVKIQQTLNKSCVILRISLFLRVPISRPLLLLSLPSTRPATSQQSSRSVAWGHPIFCLR